MPIHQENTDQTRRARNMRRRMTYAEVVLWQYLRGDKLGVRFRRQVPIGKLIVDFACLPGRLVVEVDGAHHRGVDDRRRDNWLRSKGFFVMRFWNDEVIGCPEGCVDDIRTALGSMLPPGGRIVESSTYGED